MVYQATEIILSFQQNVQKLDERTELVVYIPEVIWEIKCYLTLFLSHTQVIRDAWEKEKDFFGPFILGKKLR